MGIPRLTQDLSGYTEDAVLGTDSGVNVGEILISKVVIDGPSLVYHVYDGLLRRLSPAEVASATVPTYSDVVDGVNTLLNTLKSHGVTIEAVLFDGDLPVSKRSVRLERMENMRKQLQEFRSRHSELESFDDRVSSIEGDPWDARNRHVSNARDALPPLPFLVPAVLDAAKLSGDIPGVSVVPEEADVACARLARASGAAILTNDSDLALYELGPEGCVLVLRTLATTEVKGISPPDKVTGPSDQGLLMSYLRPALIAQRLSLPSLLNLGFERSLDSSVSTSTVVQRAKDNSMDDGKRVKLEKFREQFQIPALPPNSDNLNGLDPRTSEFIGQAMASSDNPHVYLPILHEDPSRDSSWAYGLVYRQLAYSIYSASLCQVDFSHVIEHARKGSRIAPSSVSVLDDIGISAKLEGMLEDLEGLAERLRGGRHDEAFSRYFESVSDWHAAALCIVLQGKLANGKTPLSHEAIDRLSGLDDERQSESTFTPTWEDLHLLVNAQAVLYSWRTLKQIIEWTKQRSDGGQVFQRNNMQEGFERLISWLEKMPALSEMFLDLRQMRTAGSVEERKNAASVVKRLVDLQVGEKTPRKEEDDSNRKRRKKVKHSAKPEGREKSLGSNAFSVLFDDVADSEDESDE